MAMLLRLVVIPSVVLFQELEGLENVQNGFLVLGRNHLEEYMLYDLAGPSSTTRVLVSRTSG